MSLEGFLRRISYMDAPSRNSIRSMNEARAYYSARLDRLSTGEPPHIDLGPDPRGEARLRQLRAKCGVRHG